MQSLQRFNKFHSILKGNLPQFEIAYKDSSSLMKIIATILFFNKTFMTDFITTIGYTVYFPSKEQIEKNEFSSIATLAHEYVHAIDAKRINPIIFSILYLIPIPLFLITLACGLLWWPLYLISLIFLLPLPAPFRMWAEVRGYTMTLFIINEIYKERRISLKNRKEHLYEMCKNIDKNFTGPAYYFMWPFGREAILKENANKIISGDIFREDAMYAQVMVAFEKSRN